MIINNFEQELNKVLKFLEQEFSQINVGVVNPALLNKVKVNYLGSLMQLNQCASIVVQQGSSLVVTPFDKELIKEILTAINEANLGFNASLESDKIRVPIPPLNQEKREQLTKDVKALSEKAKVSIRNIRHDFLAKVKKDSLREDETRKITDELQKKVDFFNKKIDDLTKQKSESLMKI